MKGHLSTDITNVDEVLYSFTAQHGVLEGIDAMGNTFIEYIPSKYYSITDMVSRGETIYALEQHGEEVLIYNTKTKECKTLGLNCNYKKWGNYIDLFSYKDSIFILPRYESCTYIIGLDDSIVCQQFNTDMNDAFMGVRCDNKYYSISKDGQYVVCWDLDTGETDKRCIKNQKMNIVHCAAMDKEIFILDENGTIYYWDKDDEFMRMILRTDASHMFSRIIPTTQKIVLLPQKQKQPIWSVDRLSMNIDVYNDYPLGFEYCGPDNWDAFYGYTLVSKRIVFSMRTTNYYLSIDRHTGEIKWNGVKPIPEEKLDFMTAMHRKPILREIDYDHGLQKMIDCLGE